jgi:hypothetical protein
MTEAINEQIQKVTRAFQQLLESVQPFLDTVSQTIDKLFPIINDLLGDFKAFRNTYSNRRVVHLAYHAKKERVRKKNYNRLLTDYVNYLKKEREGNEN